MEPALFQSSRAGVLIGHWRLASLQCASVATLRSTVGARGQQRSQARVCQRATGRERVGVEWGAPGSADTDRISIQRAASVAKLGGALAQARERRERGRRGTQVAVPGQQMTTSWEDLPEIDWDNVDKKGGLAAGAPSPTRQQLDAAGLPDAETAAAAAAANGGTGAHGGDEDDGADESEDEYENFHWAYKCTEKQGLTRRMLIGMLWQWNANADSLGFTRKMTRDELLRLVQAHDNAHDRPADGSTEVPVELLGKKPTGQVDPETGEMPDSGPYEYGNDEEIHRIRREGGKWRSILDTDKGKVRWYWSPTHEVWRSKKTTADTDAKTVADRAVKRLDKRVRKNEAGVRKPKPIEFMTHTTSSWDHVSRTSHIKKRGRNDMVTQSHKRTDPSQLNSVDGASMECNGHVADSDTVSGLLGAQGAACQEQRDHEAKKLRWKGESREGTWAETLDRGDGFPGDRYVRPHPPGSFDDPGGQIGAHLFDSSLDE